MRHSILQNMIESKNNNYTIYEKENNTWLGDDHGVIAWGNAADNLPGQQVVKGYKGIVIKE